MKKLIHYFMMPSFHHLIRNELEEKLSKQFFTILDYRLKAFSPEIIADYKENKLSSQYTKLLASAKIPFDGEERTLPGMGNIY